MLRVRRRVRLRTAFSGVPASHPGTYLSERWRNPLSKASLPERCVRYTTDRPSTAPPPSPVSERRAVPSSVSEVPTDLATIGSQPAAGVASSPSGAERQQAAEVATTSGKDEARRHRPPCHDIVRPGHGRVLPGHAAAARVMRAKVHRAHPSGLSYSAHCPGDSQALRVTRSTKYRAPRGDDLEDITGAEAPARAGASSGAKAKINRAAAEIMDATVVTEITSSMFLSNIDPPNPHPVHDSLSQVSRPQ